MRMRTESEEEHKTAHKEEEENYPFYQHQWLDVRDTGRVLTFPPSARLSTILCLPDPLPSSTYPPLPLFPTRDVLFLQRAAG